MLQLISSLSCMRVSEVNCELANWRTVLCANWLCLYVGSWARYAVRRAHICLVFMKRLLVSCTFVYRRWHSARCCMKEHILLLDMNTLWMCYTLAVILRLTDWVSLQQRLFGWLQYTHTQSIFLCPNVQNVEVCQTLSKNLREQVCWFGYFQDNIGLPQLCVKVMLWYFCRSWNQIDKLLWVGFC